MCVTHLFGRTKLVQTLLLPKILRFRKFALLDHKETTFEPRFKFSTIELFKIICSLSTFMICMF